MTVSVLDVDPLIEPPDTDLALPGSKSITNRALVAAALAGGTSTLHNALVAEDTLAMIDCLRALGVGVDVDAMQARVHVHGSAGKLAGDTRLWVRQSGTTARFVLPLAALADGVVEVDGDAQIRARPQEDLVEALAGLGAAIHAVGEPGRLPLRLDPAQLRGGTVDVPGHTSSQFVSALLLAAPLFADGLTIRLVGDVVSQPYIDMTVSVMAAFGMAVDRPDARTFAVAHGAYRCADFAVEPDASTASYFFAAAAASGGRVRVRGLGHASVQGDLGFVRVLEQMGARVEMGEHDTEVRGPDRLHGVEVSLRDLSDTAPTLAAIAPFADGIVRVTGIGFVRGKESDRIHAVVTELGRLGIDAADEGDGYVVHPGTPVPATVQTYDDHRIAMAFTVLGLLVPGVSIADPHCVAKTFPEFYDTVDALRAASDAHLAVLALDGPAGSGKSTVARLVADALGLEYLDTGAMYRCVTLAALERAVPVDDAAAVSALARHVEIDVGREKVLLDGRDVSAAIRSEGVNANVSEVAAIPAVRAAMRRQQRAWARRRGGGVLEGRDIGSVVFPSARLKVYVTASIEERARRRAAESGVPVGELVESMQRRDHIDSSRTDSPLTEADDAVVVDTTGMTIEEVVAEVVQLFERRGAASDAGGAR